VIGRIGDRATFQALRRNGRRTRRGPITVLYLPGSRDGAPEGAVARVRVAFGVGRKVGHAVARNKIRRRLRHIMRELDNRSGELMPGSYLVTVQPAVTELSYGELYRLVADACRAVGARGHVEGTSA
jgi:ribonuclease P protein component